MLVRDPATVADLALLWETKSLHLLPIIDMDSGFGFKPGEAVTIAGGRSGNRTGTIAVILPVTDALPMEFQNTFKPRERSQLAKIVLPPESDFPIFEKVRISSQFF